MRRLILCAAFLAITAGCNRKPRVEVIEDAAGGTAPAITNVVHVADASAPSQLISGFYDVEQNSWRWTAGKFAVKLQAPADVQDRGATLSFRFSIPDAILAKTGGKMRLEAKVNGAALAPQTYDKPGEQSYTKDVPPAALTGGPVTATFELDPFVAAGVIEARELGVVATSFALESK